MNMKNILLQTLRLCAAALVTGVIATSCDLLDRKPLDEVSPDAYYRTAEQVGGFTFGKYGSIFRNNSGWWAGVSTYDNGTDNQTGNGGNEAMFRKDYWKVPGSGGIGFNNIRDLNKFISEIEAKHKAGEISGPEDLIKHYIGEAYLIRAMLYYDRLQTYGDYPILDEKINVDQDLVVASRRMPRNEVARHILKDLDTAISMLQPTMSNKLRLNKRAALVLKSRVALYEGTFEKYHAGSGRVPGDAQWPGKDKEWNKGKTFDQAAEVDFFLSEAMSAAKTVADEISLQTANTHVMNPTKKGEYSGWNPYYEMFCSEDLTKYPEVLLWKQFNSDINVAHLTSNKLKSGPALGLSRGLVESFLMKNGKPIYAAGSGYKGDVTIDDLKSGRDERLQLFLFGETTVLNNDPLSIDVFNAAQEEAEKEAEKQKVKLKRPRATDFTFFTTGQLLAKGEERDVTGYRPRKFYNYDPKMHNGQTFSDVSGQILVRVEEAYLNYIEACYVKTNALDATARKYWTDLRKRAGIEAPIDETIAATDMSYEADASRDSYDWGAFSAGKPVDATLYSIRRERRSELISEGFRMDDLIRWRALDQVSGYHIEGMNLWAKAYDRPQYKTLKGESLLISDGGEKANVSSKDLSTYVRPFQVRPNNNLYNGYTFYEAHYLAPFSYNEMTLCSPDRNVEHTVLYQNIYWPTYTGGVAQK